MTRRDGESRLRGAMRAAGARLFAHREILIRSQGGVRYVAVPGAAQPALLLLALAFAGWVGWSSASYVHRGRALAEKDREIASGQLAYRALLDRLDASRTRFAAIASTLEDSHAELKSLVEQNGNLRAELRALHQELQVSDNVRGAASRKSADIADSIAALKGRIAGLETRNFGLVAELRDAEDGLAATPGEGGAPAAKRAADGPPAADGLARRLAGLQAAQEHLLKRTARDTVAEIARVETAISGTGIDMKRLMVRAARKLDKGEAKAAGGEGGPYIPIPKSAVKAGIGAQLARLKGQMIRWRTLQHVLHALPLLAPVNDVEIASPFGRRRDPFNGRWSMHEGIDLAGAPGTPVRATAPGVVAFVGRNGAYGKEVKIDHGLGVSTVYGHLSRILVRAGQKVGLRESIGLLGSTGRSTGPHVHYEVRLDGTPLDPFNFLKAGRDVFKG